MSICSGDLPDERCWVCHPQAVCTESTQADDTKIVVAEHYGIPSINMGLEVVRMEKDGKIGPANHVGSREVLIDRDGHPI